MKHYSVLLKECIDGLAIKPEGTYVDATLGRAGHSSEILKRIPNGHLYAFDLDETAILESTKKLESISSNFTIFHENFQHMRQGLASKGVQQVDGILLDLGVSSPQFDDGERGFSYRYDARLDMRMDTTQELDAYTIVNTYSFHDLMHIFQNYGEEPFAKQIARAIEKQRELAPIETTFELVDLIKSVLPAKVLSKKGHPAKRVFQALRIAVNDELNSLKEVLSAAISLLNVEGRLCVISFHSLEDRIVKQAFQEVTKRKKVDKRLPVQLEELEEIPYRLVYKKPIVASEEELMENNRSHSAKLRVLERVR